MSTFGALLLLAGIVSGSTNSTIHRNLIGGNSQCQGNARVRRDWDTYSTADKQLYAKAVKTAIDRGLMQPFVKVHMDSVSQVEAHETCAFILWHRRYILAFENMLRSLGTEFSCITLPYWNTMEHYKRQADGHCSNMGECSPIIYDLGGQPQQRQSRTVNGRQVSGYCYSANIFEKLCDDNQQCGCLLRNDVRTQKIPQGNSYTSLFNIVSSSKTYDRYTTQIQNNVHNEIHSNTGGMMATLASPHDILFFSWHTTIDLLLYIWHNCHLKDIMTEQDQKLSPFAFNQEDECRRSSSALSNFDSINSTSNYVMKVGNQDITEDPVIGKYFKQIGDVFYQYAESQVPTLGDYKYTYEVPQDIQRLLLSDPQYCEAAKNSNRPTTIPASATVDSDDGSGSGDGELSYLEWMALTKKQLNEKYPNDPAEVAKQLEYLDCILYNKKFGASQFSQEFIDSFLQGKEVEPRCDSILQKIANNETTVANVTGDEWGRSIPPTTAKSSASSKSTSWLQQALVTLFLSLLWR